MALALTVMLNRPVATGAVLDATRGALGKLLGVAPPPLTLTTDAPQLGDTDLAMKLSCAQSGAVAVSINGLPDHPCLEAEIPGYWAEVKVSERRTPLDLALAAAFAAALASTAGATVVDEAKVWSKATEQQPDALVSALAAPSPSSDVQQAAEAFLARTKAR